MAAVTAVEGKLLIIRQNGEVISRSLVADTPTEEWWTLASLHTTRDAILANLIGENHSVVAWNYDGQELFRQTIQPYKTMHAKLFVGPTGAQGIFAIGETSVVVDANGVRPLKNVMVTDNADAEGLYPGYAIDHKVSFSHRQWGRIDSANGTLQTFTKDPTYMMSYPREVDGRLLYVHTSTEAPVQEMLSVESSMPATGTASSTVSFDFEHSLIHLDDAHLNWAVVYEGGGRLHRVDILTGQTAVITPPEGWIKGENCQSKLDDQGRVLYSVSGEEGNSAKLVASTDGTTWETIASYTAPPQYPESGSGYNGLSSLAHVSRGETVGWLPMVDAYDGYCSRAPAGEFRFLDKHGEFRAPQPLFREEVTSNILSADGQCALYWSSTVENPQPGAAALILVDMAKQKVTELYTHIPTTDPQHTPTQPWTFADPIWLP